MFASFKLGILASAVRVASGGTAWDVSAASYDAVSHDVSGQDGTGLGLFFKPDGTKMYMAGNNTDRVYQYTLLTAWDLSTASYDSVSFDVSGQESGPSDLFFRDDGAKMYVVGNASSTVHQYTLSTAWNVGSASYDAVSHDVSGEDAGSAGLFFKDDGTKMYVAGSVTDLIYQYTLLTAWDLSTASYDSVSFDVSGQGSGATGLFLRPDGSQMFMLNGNTVHQYTLSTVWDISTASYDNVSFDTLSQSSFARGLSFKPDGAKMYVLSFGSDFVYQYSLS